METITFYSYKGGSGRSLTVANIARHLARLGQRIVVIDFDLEAPGLHYKLHFEDPDQPLVVTQGIVDYFHKLVVEGEVPGSLSDYVLAVPHLPSTPASIYLIPAGTVPSADYWRKLSQISWHELFYTPGANGIGLFLELKERIQEEFQPDFLLIDSRTGITEIGGVVTTILPEKVVCLLLRNRENLDGARAVLRSISRSPRLPGTPAIQIFPVLSRIPVLKEPEEEQGITSGILSFLNEKADRLEDTLNLSEIFVLHSQPDLQINERLLVGGSKGSEQSELLRDYLRLFARLIPQEVIKPHLSSLISRAKEVAFDDPGAAQQELENLTQAFGHPDAYRELLKFYRLRNSSSEVMLQTAQNLLELTNDSSDPLVWDTVQTSFKNVNAYQYYNKPVILRFVEECWRANGRDMTIGLNLVSSYEIISANKDHAADLLMEMIKRCEFDERVVIQCIELCTSTKRHSVAKELIQTYKERLGTSPKFLTAWAEYTLSQSYNQLQKEDITSLVAPDKIDVIQNENPALSYRLLTRAGLVEQAEAMPQRALRHAFTRGLSNHLLEVGDMFADIGRAEEFERRVKESNLASDRELQRFIEHWKDRRGDRPRRDQFY